MKRSFIIFFFSLFTLAVSAQSYEELINRAMDYVEQKDYPAAEQVMKAALRKEPGNKGNTMLLANLGTIQRNLGKYEEALISYNAAIGKYPDVIFLLHNRASLYCEMNRMEDALKDYNTILSSSPEDTEALYRRGLLYLSTKLPMVAKADFEKICQVKPDDLQGSMGLAMVMKREGEWTAAEDLYTALIYKHRTNAELYFNRAECYLQMKKLARTQDDLSKAQEYGYSEAPLYILRGQLRLAQFDKRLAKEEFLKAQELGADQAVVDNFLLLCK